MSTACVWDDLVGQKRVVDYLRAAVASDRTGHAYLFVGPPGAGKKTAARALACALMCDDDGCGACPECYRVRRGSHPDVHVISPEGATGYMVEQARDVIRDVNLSPVEASHKVYIIESADLFNDASANALLKTLEEPPPSVVFVLLAHAYDAVIPTIISRCQVVRFRRIPPSEAVALLVAQSGTDEDSARTALAASGGVVARARDFLETPSRLAARDAIVRTLKDLPFRDDLDVLDAAAELLVAVRAPLDDVREQHKAEVADSSDFLGKGALKALESKQKRELTAREREGIAEVLNVAESWLRDCLVVAQGAPDLVVNRDALDAMSEVAAAITPTAVSSALDAVNEARRRISYNVSPQLAIEAMLFDIREVLRCPR